MRCRRLHLGADYWVVCWLVGHHCGSVGGGSWRLKILALAAAVMVMVAERGGAGEDRELLDGKAVWICQCVPASV